MRCRKFNDHVNNARSTVTTTPDSRFVNRVSGIKLVTLTSAMQQWLNVCENKQTRTRTYVYVREGRRRQHANTSEFYVYFPAIPHVKPKQIKPNCVRLCVRSRFRVGVFTQWWEFYALASTTQQTQITFCTTTAQRLRRWTNIVQMWYQCFVYTGIDITISICGTRW